MNSKYIRYIFVEPRCRTRLAAVFAVAAVIAGLSWANRAQGEKLAGLRDKAALIARIDEMENDIRKIAQLEAFRSKGEGAGGLTTFTKISGIATQTGGVPSVVIDGMVYSEGSEFGEYKIVGITEQMVTLVNQKTSAIKKLYVFEEE